MQGQGSELTERLYNRIRLGNLEGVRECLSAGVDPNKKERYGHTALSFAASNLCLTPELLDILLEFGADPNTGDEDGRTALFWLVSNYPGFLRPELRKGERLPVFLALIKTLIEAGADINMTNADERTPLIELAYRGRLNEETFPAVQLLIEAGADINARDHLGRGIVQWLGMTRDLDEELLVRLIDIGADPVSPYIRDGLSQTSDLFTLAQSGDLTGGIVRGCVRALGKDFLRATDKDGRNLLMEYCLGSGLKRRLTGWLESEVGVGGDNPVFAMLDNGLDINALDNSGDNVLTLVAPRFPKADFFYLLSKLGADIYHAPNGWDTYVARSLETNRFHALWGVLQGFALVSGDIKRGFPAFHSWESSTHLTELVEKNKHLSSGEKSALAILLSAMLFPFRNEPLMDMSRRNRARGLKEVAGVIGEGGDLLESFVEGFFKVVNSMPSVKNPMSSGVKKDEARGFIKLFAQGLEVCGPEVTEFIKRHVGRKSLEKWVKEAPGDSDDLILKLAGILRETNGQGDVSF